MLQPACGCVGQFDVVVRFLKGIYDRHTAGFFTLPCAALAGRIRAFNLRQAFRATDCGRELTPTTKPSRVFVCVSVSPSLARFVEVCVRPCVSVCLCLGPCQCFRQCLSMSADFLLALPLSFPSSLPIFHPRTCKLHVFVHTEIYMYMECPLNLKLEVFVQGWEGGRLLCGWGREKGDSPNLRWQSIYAAI